MSAGNPVLTYDYRDAINGFFEFPTESARRLLPSSLQPVEPHHGLSILAVTAFEFEQSPVGAYAEVVLSIVVAPWIAHGEPMPRAAMYPILVGTTTAASREHGIEVWHLPHLPKNLEVRFDRSAHEIRVTAGEGGSEALALSVTAEERVAWETVDHRYQTFMNDDSGAYLSVLTMKGPFMEHEEERGRLILHPHAFTASLDPRAVQTTPFREQWMKDGRETIYPLQSLAPVAGG